MARRITEAKKRGSETLTTVYHVKLDAQVGALVFVGEGERSGQPRVTMKVVFWVCG